MTLKTSTPHELLPPPTNKNYGFFSKTKPKTVISKHSFYAKSREVKNAEMLAAH